MASSLEVTPNRRPESLLTALVTALSELPKIADNARLPSRDQRGVRVGDGGTALRPGDVGCTGSQVEDAAQHALVIRLAGDGSQQGGDGRTQAMGNQLIRFPRRSRRFRRYFACRAKRVMKRRANPPWCSSFPSSRGETRPFTPYGLLMEMGPAKGSRNLRGGGGATAWNIFIFGDLRGRR